MSMLSRNNRDNGNTPRAAMPSGAPARTAEVPAVYAQMAAQIEAQEIEIEELKKRDAARDGENAFLRKENAGLRAEIVERDTQFRTHIAARDAKIDKLQETNTSTAVLLTAGAQHFLYALSMARRENPALDSMPAMTAALELDDKAPPRHEN